MATYLDSNSVRIFPSSYRPDYPEAKLTSEHNFINIINSLVDTEGYVISHDSSTSLKFVINGYYFDVAYRQGVKNLWACIYVENGHNQRLISKFGESPRLDYGGKFRGVVFSEDDSNFPSYPDAISYKLCIYKDDKLNVARFSSDDVYFGERDLNNSLNPKKTATDEINDKQYKLVSKLTDKGFGLDVNNSNPAEIKFNQNTSKLLNSISSAGGDGKPVFFENGEAKTFNKTIGSAFERSGAGYKESNVYVKQGEITQGYTLYVSATQPTGSFKDGDIWFKIKE